MKSQLIIGCKKCEDELLNNKGIVYAPDGSVQRPFSTEVAYASEDLTSLFLKHFACSFCGERLEITPIMMKFVTQFFDKVFHVSFMEKAAEITNGEISFYVPYNENIISVADFLSSRGVTLINAEKYLPSVEDIQLIQKVSKQFDPRHWRFRVESAKASSDYVSDFGLWFNGLDL